MKSQLDRVYVAEIFKNVNYNNARELQDIVALTAEICELPVAIITVSDEEGDHIIASKGFENGRIANELSFFHQKTKQDEMHIVNDTWLDEDFIQSFPKENNPELRFYAGAPLRVNHGHKIGSLCVIDTKPNHLTHTQIKTLDILSRKVSNLMELELSNKLLSEQLINIERQKKALNDISIVLSHEFRGPVCSLLGIMNIIRAEDYHVPREYVEMMEQAVMALDERIYLIEEFTHLNSGNIDKIFSLSQA